MSSHSQSSSGSSCDTPQNDDCPVGDNYKKGNQNFYFNRNGENSSNHKNENLNEQDQDQDATN